MLIPIWEKSSYLTLVQFSIYFVSIKVIQCRLNLILLIEQDSNSQPFFGICSIEFGSRVNVEFYCNWLRLFFPLSLVMLLKICYVQFWCVALFNAVSNQLGSISVRSQILALLHPSKSCTSMSQGGIAEFSFIIFGLKNNQLFSRPSRFLNLFLVSATYYKVIKKEVVNFATKTNFFRHLLM